MLIFIITFAAQAQISELKKKCHFLEKRLLPKLGSVFLFFTYVFVTGQDFQFTGKITLTDGTEIFEKPPTNSSIQNEIITLGGAVVLNNNHAISSKIFSEDKIVKKESTKKLLQKQEFVVKSIQKTNKQVENKIKPTKVFTSNSKPAENFTIQNIFSGFGLVTSNYKSNDFINPEFEFVFQIISYQNIQNTFYHYYKANKVTDSCFVRPPPSLI